MPERAELRQLVTTIADPERRLVWEGTVKKYELAGPKRYTGNPCAACGETGSLRQGQICPDCFADLIKAEVARGRKDQGEGEAVSVSNRGHWNAVKRLQNDRRVPEDAPFLFGDERSHDLSPSGFFSKTLTRLCVLCLEAFPAANQRSSESLLGTSDYGGDRVRGIAPEGFTQAVRTLEAFVEWNDLNAYRDGFEAGHSLLVGLASGTMTNEKFTDETINAGERLHARIRQAETSGIRRPS